MASEQDIPSGFCLCGCGQATWIATENKASRGWVKGKHVRFRAGHHLPRPRTHPKSKVCTKCNTSKPASEFYNSQSNLDGLYGPCKECCKAQSRDFPSYKRVDREVLPEGIKRCTKCEELKPVDAFCPSKIGAGGRRADCRTCTNADHNRLYPYDAEKARRDGRLQRYGVTDEQFRAMDAAQGHACAICNNQFRNTRDQHVDHDHATNQVRALLCGKCNGGLGMFSDDPDLVASALEYLRFHARKARLA